MIASNNVIVPKTPARKGRWGWKGAMSWDLMRQDAQDLKLLLKKRRSRFLDDMLKMVSFYSYFRELLQDRRIRGYLMENHPETLKKVERTLGYLQQQALGSQLGEISMWTIAKARKDLQTLIAKARSEHPQIIGHNGQPRVVVIAANKWDLILRRYPEVEQLARSVKKPPSPAPGKSRPGVKRPVSAAKRDGTVRHVGVQTAAKAAAPAKARAVPVRRRA